MVKVQKVKKVIKYAYYELFLLLQKLTRKFLILPYTQSISRNIHKYTRIDTKFQMHLLTSFVLFLLTLVTLWVKHIFCFINYHFSIEQTM